MTDNIDRIGEEVLKEVVDAIAKVYVRFLRQHSWRIVNSVPAHFRPFISEDTVEKAVRAISDAVSMLPPDAKREVAIGAIRAVNRLSDAYAKSFIYHRKSVELTRIMNESELAYEPLGDLTWDTH